MNVLIVTGPYPPEVRSISFMIQQLANDMAERGHDVTVLACRPRHNLSEEARKVVYQEDTNESRVRVIRVKTPPNHGGNYVLRGVAQLISPYLFIILLHRYGFIYQANHPLRKKSFLGQESYILKRYAIISRDTQYVFIHS